MTLAIRLASILKKDKNFHSALRLVEEIGSGKIWLIGGAVYKNLIADLRGEKHTVKDYDFIVEKIKKPMPKIEGFETLKTFFGNPRFKNNSGLLVDVVPLEKTIAVIDLGLKPSIKSYFGQVPLSVHAVAYDVRSKRLYGPGVKDIQKGIIRIHNKSWYEHCISMSRDRYELNGVADKLGLKAQ